MECDLIGDVHGHAGKLTALLRTLGYTEGAAWTPPVGHQAIFVGDLTTAGRSKSKSSGSSGATLSSPADTNPMPID
jgi:hypothetical protein